MFGSSWTCGMIPPGYFARAAALSWPGGAAGSRDVALLCDLGRGEVARQHARRRHGGPQQTGVQHLVEVLEPGEEEQLVAVLIEAGAGDQDRAAEGAAGIVILVLRSAAWPLALNCASFAFSA